MNLSKKVNSKGLQCALGAKTPTCLQLSASEHEETHHWNRGEDSVVPVDSRGFKQYDTLDALYMDRMMSVVRSWMQDPRRFMETRGLSVEHSESCVFSLIVEGFLIFNYGALNVLFDKRYFLQIPYETCKMRRSLRVYTPPDPEGYFDGYVWPMYLKNRKDMDSTVEDLVFLDGTQKKEDLLAPVFKDIQQMFKIV
ncbi:nicotinamide riboside kinase 1-like isoform X2 [Hoplias malabaricus]|uniref:nicotinamide riboside kinase 1-like isoform X2 n=1 Tax=Hoplias malabaricus TaxID=27720 RepID=UPI0034624BD1